MSAANVYSEKRTIRVNIQLWLLDYFDEHPNAAMTTTDVIVRSRSVDWHDITKSQRVSTGRAMKAVNAKRPALRIMNGEGPSGELVIFNSHNLKSYALARKKADWLTGYLYDEPRLLARLKKPDYAKMMRPGGVWALFVEEYIAQDSGDSVRVAEVQKAIKAAQDASTAQILNKLAGLSK